MTLSSTAVETATEQCTSHWAMARGHCLNTSIVLVAVHGLSGLFRMVSTVELSLCHPLPTLSPSLIGHIASVDVKQHENESRKVSQDRVRMGFLNIFQSMISTKLNSTFPVHSAHFFIFIFFLLLLITAISLPRSFNSFLCGPAE